jgi:hypothetical protein
VSHSTIEFLRAEVQFLGDDVIDEVLQLDPKMMEAVQNF